MQSITPGQPLSPLPLEYERPREEQAGVRRILRRGIMLLACGYYLMFAMLVIYRVAPEVSPLAFSRAFAISDVGSLVASLVISLGGWILFGLDRSAQQRVTWVAWSLRLTIAASVIVQAPDTWSRSVQEFHSGPAPMVADPSWLGFSTSLLVLAIWYVTSLCALVHARRILKRLSGDGRRFFTVAIAGMAFMQLLTSVAMWILYLFIDGQFGWVIDLDTAYSALLLPALALTEFVLAIALTFIASELRPGH